MQQELIILSEYCVRTNIEPSFITLLEEEGMIHIIVRGGERYLYTSEINDLERFSRMYYDLSINAAGIDAIQNLLNRIEKMQYEIELLRKRLTIHESLQQTTDADVKETEE
ncbi:MAG: chaperone modulator CbpM [Tannerellaceae bacterium]|nr:chaperone modulator CbpM [Tannerellaceae bacterium]